MKNNLKTEQLEIENKIIKNELEEFKKFAFKGDMIKISIGIVLGNSFNSVVHSISNNIIMPIINFLISKTGNNWRNLNLELAPGLKIELGKFLGTTIDFLLVSICLYVIYIKILGKLFKETSSDNVSKT